MKGQGHTSEAGEQLNSTAVERKIFLNAAQTFGFSPQAEWLNGRLAMLGLISALLLEWLTGQGAIAWLTHL